jgi:hypothetical protein
MALAVSASEGGPAPKRLSADPARAWRRECLRAFDRACAVRRAGAAASAPLVARSMHLLLTLLVHPADDGEAAPASLALALERARRWSASSRAGPSARTMLERYAADLEVVRATAQEVAAGSVPRGPARERFERAFDACSELFLDVRRHAPSALPRRRFGRAAAAGLLALAVALSARAARSTSGVEGSYYASADFTELAYRRRDAAIDFDWRDGPPDRLPRDGFSVRWDGVLDVRENGSYTFWVDGRGARVFVDGALVVDGAQAHGPPSGFGHKELLSGEHRLRVELRAETGRAAVRLSWSSPRFARRVVRGRDLR